MVKHNLYRGCLGLLYAWLETALGRAIRRPLIFLIKFQKLKIREDYITIAAKLVSIRVGETTISPMWKAEGIEDFFPGGTDVHPLFRGIGIGRRVLAISLQEAADAFRTPIYVNIPHDNKYSIEMYMKAGFEIVERKDLSSAIEQSYIRRIGSTRRQIIMRYSIEKEKSMR